MTNRLSPEMFRLVREAEKTITTNLEKATDKQLYVAAAVLAQIRLAQGCTVPSALLDRDFGLLAKNESVAPIAREYLLDFLITA